MATYPTFTHNPSRSSAEAVLDDVQIDRASNGTAKARVLYTVPKKAFTVVHQGLTALEKQTLMDFYATNRAAEIDFLWAADGVTYSVLFAAAPKPEIGPGLYWNVTVALEQS